MGKLWAVFVDKAVDVLGNLLGVNGGPTIVFKVFLVSEFAFL